MPTARRKDALATEIGEIWRSIPALLRQQPGFGAQVVPGPGCPSEIYRAKQQQDGWREPGEDKDREKHDDGKAHRNAPGDQRKQRMARRNHVVNAEENDQHTHHSNPDLVGDRHVKQRQQEIRREHHRGAK